MLICTPLSRSSSCRGRHRLLLLSSALLAALCSHLCDFCDCRCPDPLIASFSRFPSSHLVHFLYTGGAGSVSAKSHIVYRFHRVPFEVQTFLIATPPTPCSVVKSFFLSSSFGFVARHLRWWKCFFCTCLASGRVFAVSCSLALFPVCLLCVCGFIASYSPLCSAAALWFLFLMPAIMVIARTLVPGVISASFAAADSRKV